MKVIEPNETRNVPIFNWAEDLEELALRQAHHLAQLPFVQMCIDDWNSRPEDYSEQKPKHRQAKVRGKARSRKRPARG